MGRTTTSVTRPGFIVDHATAQLNSGRKIDWDNVPASYENDGGDKVIPAGTPVSFSANGIIPRADVEMDISGLTEDGGTATATTDGDHPYEVGDEVTISGTTNYNGTFEVTAVNSSTTFDFEISGTPADESSGTATLEAKGLLVSSADEGARSDALTGYGVVVGGVVYEDLLPVAVTGYKSELDDNGNGFVWETYEDDR